MEQLLIGATGIVQLIITLFLLPLWIGLCFFIPYMLGRGANRLFLANRSFERPRLVFTAIGGAGFSVLFVFILISTIIQIFSISASEWWYKNLFLFGAIGNTVGVVCSLLFGILTGKARLN